MSVKTGCIIKRDVMVPVFMEASIDGKAVAYLIETDFSKNQKGWVDASAIEWVNKDLLKVNVTNSGDYLNVFNTPGGSVLGSIYDATFAVILDKTTYNNELWLKIYYNINNSVAWINTNISSSKGSLNYTLNHIGNQKPEIIAEDMVMFKGGEFNPLDHVKATDNEDGDITKNVKVIKNTINKDVVGEYEVTYQVTDSYNQTVVKTIKVHVLDFKEGEPLFYFESLKHISDTRFEVKGFLGVKGMNNKLMMHKIAFVKEDDEDTVYLFDLEENNNPPFKMSSLDDDKSYDYSNGWFKGEIDLAKANIREGNYYIVVFAYNYETGYYTGDYYTNIAYVDMPRRIEGKSRGISFDIDYGLPDSPMLVSIRDKGLLSYDTPTSFDPTYNFFNEIKLNNNTLSITGTSHSAYVSYSKNDDVKREIVFENTKNYERFTYDLSYIDNGLYKIELPVSDGKDKIRAWFKKDIDISKLTKGTYAIYIKTTSNNKTYYGELVDVAYTDFSKINTSKYTFKRIDESRLRVELTVN